MAVVAGRIYGPGKPVGVLFPVSVRLIDIGKARGEGGERIDAFGDRRECPGNVTRPGK